MINIDGTNFGQAGGIGVNSASEKSASINIADNKKSDGTTAAAFAGVVMSGDGVDKKAMNQNTYESLIEEADDIKSQIMQSATDAKMNLKNLMNRLSGADAVKINEDGFNLNELSDDECVNIVDRIKIELAAYNDNYRTYASDIDVDKIKQVVGSEGFAQSIAGQLDDSGVPASDANLQAIADAADKLSDITGDGEYQISMGAKLYMAANGADATLDNVRIAEHSYMTRGGGISESQWNELKPQVENVIKRAGLSVNESNLANAKALLSEDMPVTEENLQIMETLDGIDFSLENISQKTIDAIAKGVEPDKAVLTPERDIYDDVAKALATLNKLGDADISENIAASGDAASKETEAGGNTATASLSTYIQIAKDTSDDGIVSLRSLDEAYEKFIENPQKYSTKAANEDTADSGNASDSNENAAAAKMLMQIQILMTAEAGVSLERNGLNINTVPIATLHENLLALDKEIFMDELGDQLAHDIDADEAYSTVYNTREALFDINRAPVDMIGAIYKEIAYSESSSDVVSVMSAAKTGSSLRTRLNRAGAAYETMGSTVRADLGDSVNRAVEASAGTQLNDMGLEDNEKNREAVGILVRNGMDVTKENVTNIKELKSALDSLVANMTPETALDMIRNNINPYTSDIREVNEYLRMQNEENDRDLSDKYSTFLYKLDRTDGITADERQQFIGIYKMMNMFTKDAGKAIGSLVAQGADITMQNLVTAYNSRRSYNRMDMTIDDDSDINVSTYENYYMNLFTATGDKITPNTLKEVNTDKPIYERSVENFCDAADEFYDAAAEAAYLDDYMELVQKIADADASVISELERGGEDITLNNIQAMEQLMSADLFSDKFKLSKDKAQDIFDSVGDREELGRKLSDLGDTAKEALDGQIESADNTYEIVHESSINEMAAQMMVRSARREDYTVPFVTEDGIGMMKLSFKSDGEQGGKINISYEDSLVGNVSLNISVGENVSMSAVYATNAPLRGSADEREAEAAKAFREKLDGVGENVRTQFGFKSVDVAVNPVRNVSRTIYDNDGGVSNATMYKIAKTVVEGLVKIG